MPAGGVTLRTLYLSLDPYMRGRMDARRSYAAAVEVGGVMTGETVAEVIASDNPDFQVGDMVTTRTGWTTHAVSDGSGLTKIDPALAPPSAWLGVLGMPGFTAYSGLIAIGKPKPGETVVVAAATGPVGSLVGQLAHSIGARAVAIAGGPKKCAFAKETYDFDEAVDHRSDTFAGDLAAACPDGIDVYFENVGGAVWQAVLPLLNNFARVPVCGLIAQYDGGATGTGTLAATMREILSRRLLLRGFINSDFAAEHYGNFKRTVAEGLASGAIRYREDISEGLESAPQAFLRMLRGENFGKTLVRIA